MAQTPPPDVPSTLKAPPKKALERFSVGQIGDDTMRIYLQNSYSLAICCRVCERLVEWTPPELERMFGAKLNLRIADLCERLTCGGDEGCGSHDIAVFPHLYDRPWRWSGPANG